MRIGVGYDTHALKQGDFLVIGGVKIPHEKSFIAHSDGDVLLHSLCDALLGAAGLPDIGVFFPDSDPKYEKIDSMILLKDVYQKVKAKNFKVINVDNVLLCQKPKLSTYIPLMIKNISSILETEFVNIKATTTEKMNAEGEEKAISCQSICLLN